MYSRKFGSSYRVKNMTSRSRLSTALAATKAARTVRYAVNRAAMGNSLSRRFAAKTSGYVDTAAATYNFDTTGSIALIPTVAQGAAVNQRIGKKWTWKSLQCRGFVATNPDTTFNDCAMLIVYDKQPGAAVPLVTDILVTASSLSMNNDANSERFTILKRVDFDLNGAVAKTMGDGPTASCDFFLNLRNLPAQAKAAGTGAMGDLQLGAIYVVTVGYLAAGTTACSAICGFRTRFTDVNG